MIFRFAYPLGGYRKDAKARRKAKDGCCFLGVLCVLAVIFLQFLRDRFAHLQGARAPAHVVSAARPLRDDGGHALSGPARAGGVRAP